MALAVNEAAHEFERHIGNKLCRLIRHSSIPVMDLPNLRSAPTRMATYVCTSISPILGRGRMWV